MNDLANDLADIICQTNTSIPSGHLYARLMGNMTYDQFMILQNAIVATGKVKLQNHLLSPTRSAT